MGQGLRDIAYHPSAWLQTMARKLWLTIQDGEIRTNLSFAAVESFCPIVRILPLTWGFLLALAVAGLFLAWPWSRETKSLALYLAAYLLVCLVFFSASEYRYPMILALLPLAGGFLVGIFRMLQERRVVRVAGAIGIYLVMLLVANFPSKLRSELMTPALDFYNLGCEAVNRDQIDRSIPLFTRALAENPDFHDAHLELARSLWQVGNLDDARREFEAAGMAPPDSPLDRSLNDLLLEARALSEEGQYNDAASLYMKMSAREPDNPEWPYRAALIMRQNRDSATCDSLLAAAIAIYPAFAPARLELAENALSRGDTATVISQLTELRRIRIPVDSIRTRVQGLAKRIALSQENDE
jgi:tetratricopeptide (TPR) repeat protein